jgi:hypothetical protein
VSLVKATVAEIRPYAIQVRGAVNKPAAIGRKFVNAKRIDCVQSVSDGPAKAGGASTLGAGTGLLLKLSRNHLFGAPLLANAPAVAGRRRTASALCTYDCRRSLRQRRTSRGQPARRGR